MRLDGKVAIITGGARGIGKGIARSFVEAGARVVIADLLEQEGRATAAELGAKFVRTDVTSADQVQDLVAQVVAQHGGLDTLVNNAMWFEFKQITEMDEASWDRTLNVGLKSVFLLCKYGLPQLIERGGGSVINISSPNGIISNPGFPAYSAAKGGLNALTRNLAIDYGPKGVRTNAICPGFIETERARELAMLNPGDYAAAVDCHPVGRVGRPEDVGAMAVFLASDAAGFVNGAVLTVDGGLTAQSPEALVVPSFRRVWREDILVPAKGGRSASEA